MSWRSPELLWLLLLVPVFIGAALLTWRLRERASRSFGDASTLRSLVRGRSTGLRATRAVLAILALTGVILALAGPQYGARTRMLRKRGIDVVVALDFSKSMMARDVRPSRIRRAKAELIRFLDELGGDRVGMVAFAGETMEFPMTTDYSALHLFLRDLGPMDMPVGGTAIGRALVASKRLFERSDVTEDSNLEEGEGPAPRSRIVILMTDGEDHEGDPAEAARDLAAAGVQVFAVGIGSSSPEPIPTYAPDGTWTGYMRGDDGNPITTALSGEGEEMLEQIAEITHGQYLRARDGGVGMSAIRAEMAKLQQAERDAQRVTVHEDRYALFLLPAFLFLVFEAILPEAWRRRRRRPSKDDDKEAAAATEATA